MKKATDFASLESGKAVAVMQNHVKSDAGAFSFSGMTGISVGD